MRILMLGGTSFVGRAVVEHALDGGHDVTVFSRGRTGTELFPAVPRLTGDRDAGDYGALGGSSWDAVVDVSAYVPRHVQQAAHALGGGAGRYVFISTVSVYDHRSAPADAMTEDAMTEDAARLPPERGTEQVDDATYGPLKVACEDDAASLWGDRLSLVRPGVVAGPHDPTDRFTYWVRRAALGGRVAVPGRLDQPVQVVDSRDLAGLVLALLEADRPGTFNAVGPAQPVTLGGLVEVCAAAAGAQVELVEVTGATGPLVLPDPAWDPLLRRSAAAARAVGLGATPLATTAADVLAWDRGRGEPELSVGLTAEQERALLG